MPNLKQVHHQNKIGHEINESLENFGSEDRKVFCKKLHTITEPKESDCSKCPYFNGWMMGNGHECVWDDVVENGQIMRVVEHRDAKKEMMRVSKLIDAGILKKG